MTPTIAESQTFTITEEIAVRASLEQTFQSLIARDELEDVPPPRLGDGIEGIRRGRSSGHRRLIYSYMGMCQVPGDLHRIDADYELATG